MDNSSNLVPFRVLIVMEPTGICKKEWLISAHQVPWTSANTDSGVNFDDSYPSVEDGREAVLPSTGSNNRETL